MKPNNWLELKEINDYLQQEHKRHWSLAYIYSLMNKRRLSFFKIGGTRIVRKEDIDSLVCKLKPAPCWEIKRVELESVNNGQ